MEIRGLKKVTEKFIKIDLYYDKTLKENNLNEFVEIEEGIFLQKDDKNFNKEFEVNLKEVVTIYKSNKVTSLRQLVRDIKWSRYYNEDKEKCIKEIYDYTEESYAELNPLTKLISMLEQYKISFSLNKKYKLIKVNKKMKAIINKNFDNTLAQNMLTKFPINGSIKIKAKSSLKELPLTDYLDGWDYNKENLVIKLSKDYIHLTDFIQRALPKNLEIR